MAHGSFTGLRIGIATAKAFSDSKHIKLTAVNSLEGLAYNINTNSNIICSLIDAKNDNVYYGIFEKKENALNAASALENTAKDIAVCTPVRHGCKITKIIE